MIVEIVMPKMGESIMEGTIIDWKKKVGDYISKDETLLEISTDKVDSEIPCSHEGTVVEILADANETVEVGKVIAKIDSENGDQNLASDSSFKEVKSNEGLETSILPPESSSDGSSSLTTTEKTKKYYTPVVMRMATENDVPISELEKIAGTGRAGRVTKKDFQLFLDQRSTKEFTIPIPTVNEERSEISVPFHNQFEEMSKIREQISQHMRHSLDTSAHVHVFSEVDMTEIMKFISKNEKSFLSQEDFSLTVTPFIIDSVVSALNKFPIMNSSLKGSNIEYHKNLNIGLAVAVNSSLLVPVIRNCEEKNFLGLCRSINEIVSKTRSESVSPDDLSGSTFTVTNFGVFGVRGGTPIINQPNVGILGIGAIKKQPVVVESNTGDSIAIRSVMLMTLGFDHRLIDGAGGAKFIEKVRHNLETKDLSKIL